MDQDLLSFYTTFIFLEAVWPTLYCGKAFDACNPWNKINTLYWKILKLNPNETDNLINNHFDIDWPPSFFCSLPSMTNVPWSMPSNAVDWFDKGQ